MECILVLEEQSYVYMHSTTDTLPQYSRILIIGLEFITKITKSGQCYPESKVQNFIPS